MPIDSPRIELLCCFKELGLLRLAAGAYRIGRSANDVIILRLILADYLLNSGIHECPEYGKRCWLS